MGHMLLYRLYALKVQLIIYKVDEIVYVQKGIQSEHLIYYPDMQMDINNSNICKE